MNVSRPQSHTIPATMESLETSWPARPHDALSSASRSHRPSVARCALSPVRSPRVPPLTMLGPDRSPRVSDGGPNIVKNGTPQVVPPSA
jgi:hypothetical protein